MIFILLLFIQLVVFGALALLLRHFLTKEVRESTSHLQALTEDYNQKLEEVKKQKDEADKLYQNAILKAKEDAEKIRQQLLHEGQEEKERMIEQTRHQNEELTKVRPKGTTE